MTPRVVHTFRGLLFMLLLLVLSIDSAASSDDLTSTRQRLAAIAERLKQAEQAVLQNKSDLGLVHRELGNLQKERQRIERSIKNLRQRQSKLKNEVSTVNSEITKLRRFDKTRSGLLEKRLVAMYKSGNSGVLPILFGADTTESSYEDYLFFRRVTENDQQLLSETRQRRDLLEIEVARLKALKKKQEKNKTLLLAEKRELNTAKQMKQKAIKRLKGQGGNLLKSLTELRQQQERLRALVKKLESSQSAKYTLGATDFGHQRGRLRPPVKASVKIGFGVHNRPGDGELVDSNGLEFAVSAGRQVNAIWQGRVVFADSFRGFGNLLIVNHGEGYYSLYAHAEKLFKTSGDHVEKGEKIALTSDRCYFEIRHNGAPIDPKPWLKRMH